MFRVFRHTLRLVRQYVILQLPTQIINLAN